MKYLTILAIGLLLLLPMNALAWGKEGHILTALIAEQGLTPKTKEKLIELGFTSIGQDEVCNFADHVRRKKEFPQYFKSGPWHFVDIPYGEIKSHQQADDFIAAHNPNVCAQIDNFARRLRSLNTDRNDKQEAVKFLVHFVGDVHQPLQCCTRNDKGGNSLKVHYLGKGGKSLNLHHCWDTNLVLEATAKQPLPEVAQKWFTEDIGLELNLRPNEWAYESYLLANKIVYTQDDKELPRDGIVNLERSYVDKGAACVKLRIQKGGARLARLLNSIFDK
jgi:hypothetical protein